MKDGDLLPFSIVADGCYGANYRLRHHGASDHDFYYYPDMTPDELLLFLVADSNEGERRLAGAARTVMHGAVADPDGADEPERESVDVRVLLRWD